MWNSANSFQNDFVAKFDSIEISEKEFSERMKKYLDKTGTKDNILLRKQVLQNMINEKLIIRNLQSRNLDNDSISFQNKSIIKNQILINEFVKKILLDTLKVSEEEILNEFKKGNTNLRVRYLYSSTFEGAMELKSRLLKGEKFQNLSKEIFLDPALAKNGGDLGFIKHGEMEKSFDEVAFATEVGKISNPFKIKLGFAILKVEDRNEQNLFSQFDFEKMRTDLSNKVLENKIDKSINNYSSKIAENLKIKFDENIIDQLFLKHFNFNNSEIEKINNVKELPDSSKVAYFNGSNMVIKEFLLYYSVSSQRQKNRITSKENLKEFITGLIVRENILQSANEKNLLSNPDAILEYENAIQNYYLMRWKQEIEKNISSIKISDSELKKIYNENPIYHPAEINVSEILLSDKSKIAEVNLKLKKGISFEKLAKEYSIRLWSAENGGVLGFGTKDKFGPIFDTLYNLKKGIVIGPISVPPYFGFYKLIEKKSPIKKSFNEVKQNIKTNILQEKIKEKFVLNLQNLHLNLRVEINNDLLQNIILN